MEARFASHMPSDTQRYNVDPQFSFAAGDIVRLSKARKTFRKGYLLGWTEETFRIYERYPTIPPTYKLQELNSKEIGGRFYNKELQKIDESINAYWAIEKIIRTKGRGASRQLFVKWVGFPDSQNSWIKADQITYHNESKRE
ncbi:chromo domain-containing protein [Trichonephila clavipes]|nr:chromo domain-containing protein [Trichonephila clavipes]